MRGLQGVTQASGADGAEHLWADPRDALHHARRRRLGSTRAAAVATAGQHDEERDDQCDRDERGDDRRSSLPPRACREPAPWWAAHACGARICCGRGAAIRCRRGACICRRCGAISAIVRRRGARSCRRGTRIGSGRPRAVTRPRRRLPLRSFRLCHYSSPCRAPCRARRLYGSTPSEGARRLLGRRRGGCFGAVCLIHFS